MRKPGIAPGFPRSSVSERSTTLKRRHPEALARRSRARLEGRSRRLHGRAASFEALASPRQLKYPEVGVGRDQSFTHRSRSALATTLTDDSAIAAAANIGESVRPIAG